GRFADLAAAANTPAARRVGALALARFAEMVPEPLAVRARADAARAFLEAGDRAAARDVLERVARDSAAPADAQALAQSAVIEALIDGGQLDEAGRRLDAEGRLTAEGRAALRPLVAGRVAARLGPDERRVALALFAEVVRTGGSGAAAPAAELEWARLLERDQRTAEAIQHLEHLILSYPGSAVVPEARRELERAK